MSTAPQFTTLDRIPLVGLDDLVVARAGLLRQVAERQHALLSGWGGPPQARTLQIQATNGATASRVVSYRVPPGVTHANVSLLLEGRGTATLTTAADTTGTQLRNSEDVDSLNGDVAQWHATEGVYDATEGAESGRALQLVSAAAWSHQDVDVTVAIDAEASMDFAIWAAVFRPVHVPR